MIHNLKPYPAYKDSGVSWLGEVPAHWEVAMVKQNYTIQLGKMLQNGPNAPNDVEIPYLKAQHVQWFHVRTTDAPKMWASQNDISQFGVAPGDLLVCEGGEGGRCSILKQEGDGYIIQNALHRVRPREQSRNDFLQYVMSSVAAAGWFDALNDKATIAHFTREKFSALRVPIPPLPEQTAIVRFLDHADRRIRRYIRAKQKLLALLEEQKQAIIHQAVTGQIAVRTGQPYPAYRPSGVEWLGDVPAHWEVVVLRRRWRVIDCKHLTVPFVDSGIPLASVREAQSFELNFKTSNRTTPEWYEKLIEGGREPRPGDLIYCRNVSVGAAALVTTEDRFAMGQDVCLIRSSSENQRWLNYFLHSKVMSDQLALILVGSTFNRINVADIKALLIAVPPVSEQDRIAAVLDDEQSKIAVAIGNCRREQALLHEYRTRLIADVVTGKLDVREAAAALPEGDPRAVEDELGDTHAAPEVLPGG